MRQYRQDSRRIFVDTAAHAALIDTRDQWHSDARRVAQRLIEERWILETSNYIVAETHALLLNRRGRALAARFLRAFDRSTVKIWRISEADELRAREIIEQYDDKAFTLTDAASFAVMERLGLRYAFTFDRHFD